jgi:hypothetical protein
VSTPIRRRSSLMIPVAILANESLSAGFAVDTARRNMIAIDFIVLPPLF